METERKNPLRDAIEIDRNLKVGDFVEARWTNCYRYYALRASIVKLNEKSVRVRLEEDKDGYTKSREISIPRLLNWDKHGISNCVVPLETPESAGPKYTRGTIVPHRGKVTKIYQTVAGYEYEFDASYAGA